MLSVLQFGSFKTFADALCRPGSPIPPRPGPMRCCSEPIFLRARTQTLRRRRKDTRDTVRMGLILIALTSSEGSGGIATRFDWCAS